ncbi:hypothetical protein ACFQ69_17925 [Streptomyces sp. NPDC056470]|uniref:hypothetical protein n=1 Tax=Streptomyces sp. NPDC056470 TaxID=3345831 RepID=UPI0036A57A18
MSSSLSFPRVRELHRPLVWFSASMALLAAIAFGGVLFDDRILVGVPIWTKPFKFAVSFVAYCMTLAWTLTLLPRGRRVGWWAGTAVSVTSLIEMVLITMQAIRGRQSHFNHETSFDSAVFQVMGATVALLWLAALVIAVLLLRARILDRATAWSVRLASLIALVGAAIGFVMTQPTPEQLAVGDDAGIVGAHSVGVPDGGPSMALTGWSTTGGDLRIAHFFGMHALQVIPLVLLLLVTLAPRFARLRDERVRLRLTFVASGTYAALFALVTWQALRGQALLDPDGVTLATAGAIALLGAGGTWAALRAPNHTVTAPTAKEFVS